MATYEWRVAKNGTRRYVRLEGVPAPKPSGPQPVESDATVKVIPAEPPTITARIVTPSIATVTPAAATTLSVTTRRKSTTKASKPRSRKKSGG